MTLEQLRKYFFNYLCRLYYWIERNPFSVIYACIALLLLKSALRRIKKARIHAKVQKLASNSLEMSAEQFLTMRKVSSRGRNGRSYALECNFAGVYILHNKTQDKFYVGQSQAVLNRVSQHFTGHGNGDVYADYRNGDRFTVRMIALENSNFPNLNALERAVIDRYHAYTRGYNKTRGNRG